MTRTFAIRALFIMLFVLTPVFAFAQGQIQGNIPGTSEGNPLVNCGNGTLNKDGVPSSAECTYADLIALVQNILNIIFALGGFVMAAMFAYAGFLMITASGNASQIQRAKNIFKRVVIGFLIIFCAFVLVGQILKSIGVNGVARQIIGRIINLPQ